MAKNLGLLSILLFSAQVFANQLQCDSTPSIMDNISFQYSEIKNNTDSKLLKIVKIEVDPFGTDQKNFEFEATNEEIVTKEHTCPGDFDCPTKLIRGADTKGNVFTILFDQKSRSQIYAVTGILYLKDQSGALTAAQMRCNKVNNNSEDADEEDDQ